MGVLSEEINNLVKNSRGIKTAKLDAIKWYKKTLITVGEKSVRKTNTIFKPGKIYVFKYLHPVSEEKIEWWDLNPVVLSLGRFEGNDIGINLNLIPYKNKVQLLDKIYSFYKPFLDTKIKQGSGDVNAEPAMLNFNYLTVKPFLERMGFSVAVRIYKTNLRVNSGVISYADWHRVALLDLAHIRKGTINDAYAKYRNHLIKKRE